MFIIICFISYDVHIGLKCGMCVLPAEKDVSIAPSDVETGWSALGLSYSVQWPLHIFFTPSILHKYVR